MSYTHVNYWHSYYCFVKLSMSWLSAPKQLKYLPTKLLNWNSWWLVLWTDCFLKNTLKSKLGSWKVRFLYWIQLKVEWKSIMSLLLMDWFMESANCEKLLSFHNMKVWGIDSVVFELNPIESRVESIIF